MKTLLVIMFFLNGPNNPPQFVEGYLPLQFDSYDKCESVRLVMEKNLSELSLPPYHLSCYGEVPPGRQS